MKNKVFLVKIYLLIGFCLLAISGCTPDSTSEAITETIVKTSTSQQTESEEAQKTATSSELATADTSSAAQPQITNTPTPIVTPTPNLPVKAGMSFPYPQEPITSDNAKNIQALIDYGTLDVLPEVTFDGKLLFLGSTRGIEVYDTETYEIVKQFPTRIRNNHSRGDMSITPDGSYILVINEENLVILSFEDGEILKLPTANSAAISPDGKQIVISNENQFDIIDVENNETIYSWDSDINTLHGENPEYSADGSTLLTWFGNRLWLWDTENRENINNYWLENTGFNHVSWSICGNGSRLAISRADTVEIWHTKTNHLIKKIDNLSYNNTIPNQVVFSVDSTSLAILEPDKKITHWFIDESKARKTLETDLQDSALIRIVDDTLITYPLPKGKMEYRVGFRIQSNFKFLQDHSGVVFINYITPGTGVVNSIEEACILPFEDAPNCFRSRTLLMGADNQFYTTQQKSRNMLELINIDTQEPKTNFQVKEDYTYLNLLGLTPDNNLFFFGLWDEIFGKGRVFYLDIEKRTMHKPWTGYIRKMIFSPDNKYAAFFLQEDPYYDLVIYDLEERSTKSFTTFDWCSRDGTVMDFSPDSKNLVLSAGFESSGNESEDSFYPIAILPLDTPEELQYVEFRYSPMAVEYSPDGKLLAIGHGGGAITLFDPESNTIVHQWSAYENDEIAGLAFSEDSTLLASSSNNGSIKIWGIAPQQ